MRFDRKNRTDIKHYTGQITNLIDSIIKSSWFINDEELEYISENITDEELPLLLFSNEEKASFGGMRKAFKIVEKYLEKLYKEKSKPWEK